MKDVFVKSDSTEVGNFAEKVKSDLTKVDMSLLEGNAHMEWMTTFLKS